MTTSGDASGEEDRSLLSLQKNGRYGLFVLGLMAGFSIGFLGIYSRSLSSFSPRISLVDGRVYVRESVPGVVMLSQQPLQKLPTAAAVVSNHSADASPAKPIMVIHVGTHKTGTTSLQGSLCYFDPRTERTLLKDNWVYIGSCYKNRKTQYLEHKKQNFVRNPRGNYLLHIMDWDEGPTNSGVSEHFLQKVNETYASGRNALVVFESFSGFSVSLIEQFANALMSWEVHIVIVYRPLYDFLPSMYAELTRQDYGRGFPADKERRGRGPTRIRKPFDLSDDRVTAPAVDGKTSAQSSPSGDHVLCIRLLVYLSVMERTGRHAAQVVRDKYRRFFDRVQVIPTSRLPPPVESRADPLFEYLLCNVLEATNSCKDCHKWRKGRTLHTANKISYDLLAIEANRQGYIDSAKTDRWKANGKIRNHQQDVRGLTDVDFDHMSCLPNATLDRLYNLSWTVEKNLLFQNDSYLYASPGLDETMHVAEARHRDTFTKRIESKKYCHVDAKSTLENDSHWIEFFQHFHDR